MWNILFGRRNKKMVDPVCHMEVASKGAEGSWSYKGQTYYFCGPGCNKAFQKEPDEYLSGKKKIVMPQ